MLTKNSCNLNVQKVVKITYLVRISEQKQMHVFQHLCIVAWKFAQKKKQNARLYFFEQMARLFAEK